MNSRSIRTLVASAVFLGLGPSAHAQVSRVFVSVSGNDGNNCINLDTPCRTIAGGIAQVDAKGEVIIVASGSYAGGTITKEVKINAAPGVVAFSGLPFTINPGLGKTVVLRGLTIKAATAGSGTGVTHNSGNLLIENCVVDGWQDGILMSMTQAGTTDRLSVTNTTIRSNVNAGINAFVGDASVSHVQASNNGVGILATGAFTRLILSHSVVDGSISYGISQSVSAIFLSMGNNVVEGNGTNTFGTITTGTLK